MSEVGSRSVQVRGNPYVPIDQKMVSDQLADLMLRSVLRSEQDDYEDKRADVVLTWPPDPEGSTPARCLGLYAKWLVVLDQLFEADGGERDLKAILGLNSNEPLRKLFLPSDTKALKEPFRYDPTGRHRQATDNHEQEDILKALLEKLNDYRTAVELPAIDLESMVDLQVDLQPGSTVVGSWPIARFQHWLEYQRLMANPPVERFAAEEAAPELIAQANDYVRDVLEKRDMPCTGTKVAANFTGSASDGTLSRFSFALRSVLAKSADDLRYAVVRVSLGAGNSRRRVLASLYAQLCPDRSLPVGLEARALDLSADLFEIRDALTISPVVVILEDWDNNAGPFGALRNFICDSHWGEFIRAMMQPVQARLLQPGTSPQVRGRLVVLSSGGIDDLTPWLSLSQTIRPSPNQPLQVTEKRLLEQASVALHETTWSRGPMHGVTARPVVQVPPRSSGRDDAKDELAGYLQVALRLVAVSVNGMQHATLQRCLKQWVRIFGWTPNEPPSGTNETYPQRKKRITSALNSLEDPAKFSAFVAELLERFHDMLWEVDDEELEGLSVDTRASELDRSPMPVQRDPDAGPPKSIQFRSRAQNAAFVRQWIGLEDPSSARVSSSGEALASWEHLNFMLAEECLRQATVQMRHLHYSAHESAQSSRRFLQAIYHGLTCLKLDVVPVLARPFLNESTLAATGEPALSGTSALENLSGSLYDTTTPLDGRRRFRYWYLFAYRQCVEGGDWRMGRSLGRSDVRLDVLTMFTQPALAHLMMAATSHEAELRLLPPVYQLEQPLPAGGPALRCDLLEALGRAGLDAGTKAGRQAVEWVLSVLPGWRLAPPLGDSHGWEVRHENHEINRRLPARERNYQEVADAALKLRLDWLQSSGDPEDLNALVALGFDQLRRMAIDPSFLDALPDQAQALITMAQKGDSGVTRQLLLALGGALRQLAPTRASVSASMIVSDVLYRLAEAYGTQADNEDFRGRFNLNDKEALECRRRATRKFAQAGAVYWLADRMRSRGGAQEDAGTRWPTAGARGTRYYIRVCMKLGRLILDEAPRPHNERIRDFSLALLDHAKSRLGLFTRHHFRYDRERISGLLLESARIRSWVRINAEQALLAYRQQLGSRQASRKEALEWQRLANIEFADQKRVMDQFEETTKRRMQNGRPLIHYEVQQLNAARTEHRQNLERVNKKVHRAQDAVREADTGFKELRDRCLDQLRLQLEILQRSLSYIDEAERALLALGFQARHVRRLFLERAKFATAIVQTLSLPEHMRAEEGAAPVPLTGLPDDESTWPYQRELLRAQLGELAAESDLFRHLSLATSALEGLEATSVDDSFWLAIHQRQNGSLEKSRKAAAAWLLPRSGEIRGRGGARHGDCSSPS